MNAKMKRDSLIEKLNTMSELREVDGKPRRFAKKGHAVDDVRDVLVELERVNKQLRR